VSGDLTPADLRALAARAEQLAAEIDAAQSALRGASDEPTRRVGYRLDEGAGNARQAARALIKTAEDLARIRSRDARTCRAEWGVCPEHGNTLVSSGGRSWCNASGCGRSWDWDRGGLPCLDPAAWRLWDLSGKEMLVCAGHALAARKQLVGARLEPLGEGWQP
jgi:hypothetical protein